MRPKVSLAVVRCLSALPESLRLPAKALTWLQARDSGYLATSTLATGRRRGGGRKPEAGSRRRRLARVGLRADSESSGSVAGPCSICQSWRRRLRSSGPRRPGPGTCPGRSGPASCFPPFFLGALHVPLPLPAGYPAFAPQAAPPLPNRTVILCLSSAQPSSSASSIAIAL